jgi:hypothetical protein
VSSTFRHLAFIERPGGDPEDRPPRPTSSTPTSPAATDAQGGLRHPASPRPVPAQEGPSGPKNQKQAEGAARPLRPSSPLVTGHVAASRSRPQSAPSSRSASPAASAPSSPTHEAPLYRPPQGRVPYTPGMSCPVCHEHGTEYFPCNATALMSHWALMHMTGAPVLFCAACEHPFPYIRDGAKKYFKRHWVQTHPQLPLSPGSFRNAVLSEVVTHPGGLRLARDLESKLEERLARLRALGDFRPNFQPADPRVSTPSPTPSTEEGDRLAPGTAQAPPSTSPCTSEIPDPPGPLAPSLSPVHSQVVHRMPLRYTKEQLVARFQPPQNPEELMARYTGPSPPEDLAVLPLDPPTTQWRATSEQSYRLGYLRGFEGALEELREELTALWVHVGVYSEMQP